MPQKTGNICCTFAPLLTLSFIIILLKLEDKQRVLFRQKESVLCKENNRKFYDLLYYYNICAATTR